MKSAAAALLLLCGAALAGGCSASSYVGIPLAAGAADSQLQELARRARAGDAHAQLELGIRFEEGRGVEADAERALTLYRRAARGGDLSRMAYVPGHSGRPGSWTILSGGGGGGPGLPEAEFRLFALTRSEGARRVPATLVDAGRSDPEVCRRLERALRQLYDTAPAECDAFPFDVRLPGGGAFRAYDLIVSIPGEVADDRGYSTNFVDPVTLALINRTEPVSGRLTYVVAPAEGGTAAIILNFEAAARR
jgi:hypothetical protein